MRRSDNDDWAMLCQKTLRWRDHNLKALTAADPAVPDTLNDRAADNWRPLLAVADRAGGEWPKGARATPRLFYLGVPRMGGQSARNSNFDPLEARRAVVLIPSKRVSKRVGVAETGRARVGR